MAKRPKRRIFFRHSALNFLAGRQPAKICLDWRKNLSPLGIPPIFKQGLATSYPKAGRIAIETKGERGEIRLSKRSILHSVAAKSAKFRLRLAAKTASAPLLLLFHPCFSARRCHGYGPLRWRWLFHSWPRRGLLCYTPAPRRNRENQHSQHRQKQVLFHNASFPSPSLLTLGRRHLIIWIFLVLEDHWQRRNET